MRAMAATPPPYPAGPTGGKLDTADSFERIFGLYAHQFAVLIPTAIVIFVPLATIAGIASRTNSVALSLIDLVLSLIGQALYTGAVVEAVNDMRNGSRDFTLGDLLRSAAPFVLTLVFAGFLFGMIVGVGLLLFIVPGLVFLTWFCLIAPIVVVERQGVFAAMTRSRALVVGNGWRVFGVMLVTFLIVAVVGGVFGRIAHAVSGSGFAYFAAQAVGNVLTAPILALAVAVLYFQLRDIRQGTSGLSAPAPPPRP
jgi:hypothetical protein